MRHLAPGQLKRLASRLLLGLFLVFLGVFLFDVAVDSGLRRSTHGRFAFWNDITSGALEVDAVVLGSSSASEQISPEVVEAQIGLKSYNLGVGGYGIRMQKAALDVFLSHHPWPDIVLLAVGRATLMRRRDLVGPEQFLPYLEEPALAKVLKEYEGLPRFAHSPARYLVKPRLVYRSLQGWLNSPSQRLDPRRGFRGVTQPWATIGFVETDEFYRGVFETEESIQLLEELTSACRQSGARLVLVYPPEFSEGRVPGQTISREFWSEFSGTHELLLLDFSQAPMSREQKYYNDKWHLNLEGAHRFSEMVAQELVRLGVSGPK